MSDSLVDHLDPKFNPVWKHEGYIYFMQRKYGGIIKIGRTTDASKRLSDLRQEMGWPSLVIKAMHWVDNAVWVETQLHRLLRKYQVKNGVNDNREWYEDNDVVRQWMINIASGQTPAPFTVIDPPGGYAYPPPYTAPFPKLIRNYWKRFIESVYLDIRTEVLSVTGRGPSHQWPRIFLSRLAEEVYVGWESELNIPNGERLKLSPEEQLYICHAVIEDVNAMRFPSKGLIENLTRRLEMLRGMRPFNEAMYEDLAWLRPENNNKTKYF